MTDSIQRLRHQWGERFSDASLAPQFLPYLHSGQRIRVRSDWGDGDVYERTGTVGITTGWNPIFLLIHRSSDSGSSDVLHHDDEIVAVKRGRDYVPVR